MTPKEKANKLLDSLYDLGSFKKKKLAITVLINEILSLDTSAPYQEENYIQNYYSEVKKEIEKL